ncbi:hypothetical protein ACTHPH_18795 [Paenibacillus pasadenensis]|uniref:Uncharacterized protein n=1 Tax=Paenibacillus pasadenensis TaxID=217090 RepID=A0A2N5N6D2_9BACL|nr:MULTISPECIES: hypothetical protein [Paenibacillus]PLT45908.1 hypothetical protein B8V81_4339 [Paenibacillus pasadenensis]QGG56325.1 hypothetical protein GE073_12540 [Paenibacillus sp. B01]
MKKSLISILATASILFYFISTANAVGGDYQPVQKTADTQTDYIESITHKEGKWYITVDPIEWYEGKEADEQFLKHEPDSGLDGAPDGYYIVNDDTTATTYEISPDAAVLMQLYDRTGDPAELETQWNEPVALDEFAKLYAKNDVLDLADFPYHLTVKDGVVTKIVQQFIP